MKNPIKYSLSVEGKLKNALEFLRDKKHKNITQFVQDY